LATTFYNDNDEAIAPDLVKILIECEQEIPSFLERFKPDDVDNLKWGEEDNSDGSDAGSNAGDAAGGEMDGGEDDGTWGTTGGDTVVEETGGGSGW